MNFVLLWVVVCNGIALADMISEKAISIPPAELSPIVAGPLPDVNSPLVPGLNTFEVPQDVSVGMPIQSVAQSSQQAADEFYIEDGRLIRLVSISLGLMVACFLAYLAVAVSGRGERLAHRP